MQWKCAKVLGNGKKCNNANIFKNNDVDKFKCGKCYTSLKLTQINNMALLSMKGIMTDYYNARCVCNSCGKDSKGLAGFGGCTVCSIQKTIQNAGSEEKSTGIAGILKYKPDTTDTNADFNSVKDLFALLGSGKGSYQNSRRPEFAKLSTKLNDHVRKSAYLKINIGEALKQVTKKPVQLTKAHSIQQRRYALADKMRQKMMNLNWNNTSNIVQPMV